MAKIIYNNKINKMFDKIYNFFTDDKISNFASIAGFLISLYLLWGVRKIKNYYFTKSLLPYLDEKLKNTNSDINRTLSNFEDEKDFCYEKLNTLKQLLILAKKHVDRSEKKHFKFVIELIEKIDLNTYKHDEASRIYGNSIGCHQIIVNNIEINKRS